MKKKLKVAIPFAVLTLTCGISAGVFAGCNTHEHNYSEWKNEGSEHVRVCPEDGEKDESTRAPHEFFGGICDVCGADENAGKQYGTASGQIKLHKLGGYETDYTGVTIDMGDDDVIAEVNPATGEFTIEDAVAGKDYNLKISKAGYKDYKTVVNVEADKNTVIGGSRGAVLEYDAFGLLADYDANYHDFSHVNEENPTLNFLENDGTKTLNVLSKDGYSELSATMHLEFSNSLNGLRTQGIVLKFDDGKHVIVRYHNGDMQNGNIQYANNLWSLKAEDTLFSGTDSWAWGEHKLRDLTSAETAALKADGIDLTVMLKDGAIHTFLGGVYIESYALPEEYAGKNAQVGYFIFNTVSNASVSYEIKDSAPELKSTLNINVTNPEDGTECRVDVGNVKDKYELTDTVELTFYAPEGYKLEALTINGADRYGDVKNNILIINTNRLNVEVNAVFAKQREVALDVTVKGVELGKTENLAQGTNVTFKNTEHSFRVSAEGKITGNILAGRYTVVANGYFEKTLNIDEDTTEIVLERDTFKEILGWGNFNFENQNAEEPEFAITNDCAVVLTNKTYDSGVMASIYLKGNNMNAGNAGIVFRFVGNGLADNGESFTVLMQGTKKVQVADDKLWDKTTVAAGCNLNNLIYFESGYDDGMDRVADEHSEEYLQSYANGTLKLSILRDGVTFYVYLNNRLVGKHTLDVKYAGAKCEVGFMSGHLQDATSWKSWKVEIEENVTRTKEVSVTNGTAANAHGTVTIPAGNYIEGDNVNLTITPETGYVIKKLTVGGRDVTSQVAVNPETQTGTCSVMLYGDSAVVAEFEAIVYGSIGSAVNMKKMGETVALTDGTEVTLSNSNFIYKCTVAGGKINLDRIAAGTYKVSAQGVRDASVTITEAKYETAILFEYVRFTSWLGFDDHLHDYSHVNDAQPVISVNGDGGKTMDIISTDEYGDVALTINAKNSNAGVIQGMVLKFSDGKCAIFNLKTDQTLVQFRNEYWGKLSIFVDESGNTVWKESGAGSVTQSDIDKFNGDGVEVKLVRKGGKLYCFVDGRQVYSIELPAAYVNDQVQVGFFASDVKANAVWNIDISTDLPEVTD